MKYSSKVLLILLSILALTAIQLYNYTDSTAITTTALSLITSNNIITTQEAAATSNIPSAESVYASQSITLPSTVKSFVWYIVDEAHENTYTRSTKKFQIITQTIFQLML